MSDTCNFRPFRSTCFGEKYFRWIGFGGGCPARTSEKVAAPIQTFVRRQSSEKRIIDRYLFEVIIDHSP